MAEVILSTVVQVSGRPSTVIGPDTALKALLERNGWSLSPEACLIGPGHVKLPLFTSAAKDIVKAVQTSWLFSVCSSFLHCQGLHQVGVPCPMACEAALGRLPSAQQRTVALHVVGAFQTAATKFLLGGAPSPSCPWCGQDETRPHRFLSCPAFAPLRCKHQQAVDILAVHRLEWVYAPFPTLPDEVDILALLFQSRPPPAWPLHSWPSGDLQLQQGLRFYTDGSCANPAEPHARHAGWALIVECTFSRDARREGLAFWDSQHAVPPCLRVIDHGLVPGSQTIQRAELCAALQAVRHGHVAGRVPVEVITDSAFSAGEADDLLRTGGPSAGCLVPLSYGS